MMACLYSGFQKFFWGSSTKIEFSKELLRTLCYETDIGRIPRKTDLDVSMYKPKYLDSANWNFSIQGCYCCSDSKKEFFGICCSKECLFYFHDWCIERVEFLTQRKFCRFPGCDKACVNNPYCGTTHRNEFGKQFPEWVDHESLKKKFYGPNGPNWYNSKNLEEQDPDWYIPHHRSPNLFAWGLTHLLYYLTDVGPIPREIFPLMSPPPHKIVDFNWNAEIPECYWCCTHPKKNNVACSNKCLFLFNEWLHKKCTKLSKKKLCKYIGCDSYSSLDSQCCTQTHSLRYDKYKEFRPLLKSTEFALGPKWYDDTETTHIDFYNSDEPFYEFTNFYNCEKLFVDLISWTTSEHAFQGNKFVGTPLMTHVSSLDTPRKAFEFARIPMVQRWIRPDWHSIKTQVMLNVLRHKFVQNPDLADILNRTGGKHIYEHTRNDKFWGDGGDRSGANKLGELLMKVRSELRMSTPYLPNTLNHFPIPDKVDIPLNQNPTPSYSSSSKPEDVNTGAESQFTSQVEILHQIFVLVNPDAPTSTCNPDGHDTKHGKGEDNSSANSLTKVKLNESFSGLQSNDKVESNLSPAPTDISHDGASNNVLICDNARPKSDALSHLTIDNTSHTNQPDPTNSTLQNSPNSISGQWTNVSHQDALANLLDAFDPVIPPHVDHAYPDIPVGVQVTSGCSMESSHNPTGVVRSSTSSTDGMQ